MVKIDLNVPLVGLDGKQIEQETVGKMFAKVIAGSVKGSALKMWEWAKKLYDNQPIEMDRTDAKFLRQFVEESEVLTNQGKAQVMEVIDKAIEDEQK